MCGTWRDAAPHPGRCRRRWGRRTRSSGGTRSTARCRARRRRSSRCRVGAARPGPVSVLPAVREGRPAVAASRLKVTGRSNRAMERWVSAQSCTLTGPPIVTRERAHPALRIDDRHLDLVAPPEEVGHRVELAGERVALGVGRVAAVERAAEVAGPDRLELVGQLVRERARFHDGKGAGRVADDVGVGCEVHAAVHRTGAGLLAEGARDFGRPHPAVAVPLGPPVAAGGSRAPCRRR